MLLEDNAKLTKRVATLEDNQEKLIKFLKARFPAHGNKLKKLLQDPEETRIKYKPRGAYSSFGQEDNGLSTSEAIGQCFTAKPVSVDPVLNNVGISGKVSGISASLRG